MRAPPISGANTMAAMIIAGRFNVEDPCVMARVVSTPEPLLRNAEATGTIHAEQRFMAGPMSSPFSDPLTPVAEKPQPLDFGNRKASVVPATRKAKIIPNDTSLRYVREKSHHRESNDESGDPSMQNPWKHWATGDVATARSARTVSSLGTRLNTRMSGRRTDSRTWPTIRRFFAPVSYIELGKPMIRICALGC